MQANINEENPFNALFLLWQFGVYRATKPLLSVCAKIYAMKILWIDNKAKEDSACTEFTLSHDSLPLWNKKWLFLFSLAQWNSLP